jgi:hypothetical protein
VITTEFVALEKRSKRAMAALGGAILIIGGLLMFQYYGRYNSDKPFHIKIEKVTSKLSAKKVAVGLYINNFSKFSFYSNRFIFNGVIWFRFPKKSMNIDTIGDFRIHSGALLQKSKPFVKYVDNDVVVCYKVTISCMTYLDYKYFPFSDHQLNIVIENWGMSPKEIVFVSDKKDFRHSEHLFVSSWELAGTEVKTGIIESVLQEGKQPMDLNHPSAVFTMKFDNLGFKRFITLYLPLFLMFFMTLFTLLINVTRYDVRLSLVATNVAAVIYFRMVINSLGPKTNMISVMDATYFVLVAMSIVVLFFQTYLGFEVVSWESMADGKKKAKLTFYRKINDIVFYSLLVSLLCFLVYIVIPQRN